MQHLRLFIPLVGLLFLAGIGIIMVRPQERHEYPGQEAPPETALTRPVMPDHSARIVGRVLDPAGPGVGEVSLVVLQGSRVSWTFSQADGSFELDGLAPGVVSIALDHERFPATRMEGIAGDTPIDLVLPSPLASIPIIEAPRGEDLSATIHVPTKLDLQGFEVSITPSPGAPKTHHGYARRTLTDSAGSFEFPDLIPGEYLIRLIPPGRPGASWPDLLAPRNDSTLRFRHPQDALRFAYTGGRIEGVFHAPEGHYPGGAVIEVRPRNGDAPGMAPKGRLFTTQTDAEGSYTLEHLPPGAYSVTLMSGTLTQTAMVEVPPLGWVDPGF